jgi:hypothetical protein
MQDDSVRRPLGLVAPWVAVALLGAAAGWGIATWGDPQVVPAVDPAGVVVIARAAAVAAGLLGVVIAVALIRRVTQSWTVPALLTVAVLPTTFGWRAAEGLPIGTLNLVAMIVCLASVPLYLYLGGHRGPAPVRR